MAARPRKPLRQRAAEHAKGMFRSRFTCSCCPGKNFRGYRALNAHHLARHGGYWTGQKARAAGRKMSKQADAMRRHARGWRESHGLLDHRGNTTAKGRSRPDGPVRSRRDLKDRARHERDHTRADRHDTRAERHEARGKHGRAERSRQKAKDLRGRYPERAAPAPRPAPARTPPARSRPAPARNGRTNGPAPRPLGRLAPQRPAPANGRTRT